MNRTYEPMFPLLGDALIYLVLVMLFTRLLAKFDQSDRESASPTAAKVHR